MLKPVVHFDESAVDDIFAELNQCRLPGAAVGIAIDRVPVYRKGFGLASMDFPVVLSPSTRLRIASTSKHFTCLAYLLLCEDGFADIDDSVGKYLPELNGATRNATMRQLMGNTSGLRDVYDIFNQFNEPYAHGGGPAQWVRSHDLFRLYCDIDDVNAKPGTAWIYNNGGWLLLSVVIERISGQTLEQVMLERIFKPIGMSDSLLLRSDVDFVGNRGSQHVLKPAGGFERLSWGVDNFLGAGAVMSTVDDMLKWLAHMDAPSVGNEATWNLIKAPHHLQNGCSTGYGLGLMIDRYRGVDTLHHGGNAFGGNVQMLKVPSLGLDVMVMVNRQDVWAFALVNKILDACLHNLNPIVKKPRGDSFVTGTFRSATSDRIVQMYGKNGQQIAVIGAGELPLESDENGVLRYTELWSEAKLTIKIVGNRVQPDAILLNEFDNIDELQISRVATAPDTRAIVGRYRAVAGIDATISETEAGVELLTKGQFGSVAYLLEYIGQHIWRARPLSATRIGFLGGVLSFEEDGAALRFSSVLTRSLPFRRIN
jgi:D-aminopeptidase